MTPVVAWTAFAVIATAAVMAARAASDTGRRAFEYMPDMAHSLPYDSFAPNPVTRDGKTLQAPVPGTVPRGFDPFRYDATPADAERAGRELSNPVPPSTEALARGRELYETFCLVCHGPRGRGDGPLVPKIPSPPAYDSERVRSMPPGQIFHVISRGSGRMPSYGAQIPPAKRWLIVHYVHALRTGLEP
jgi:mono/diheme cytochrome c family protein